MTSLEIKVLKSDRFRAKIKSASLFLKKKVKQTGNRKCPDADDSPGAASERQA